ncbi:MAG: SGNH/GDSL hydrolase family protein [Terracidiphilus sp.]
MHCRTVSISAALLFAYFLVPPTDAQSLPQTPNSFSLHDGDRVTFYGDSITAQREYTEDIEEYVLTRFPMWKVSFHNAGVGGDKVSGGYAGPVDLRLDRDVFAWRPDVVTMMLGMNDGYYRQDQPGIFDTYAEGYRHIVESIQQHLPNAQIVLIRPSPYDDVTREPLYSGGYNGVLLRDGDFLARLSAEKHLPIADFNTPVTEFLKLFNKQFPDIAQQLIPDRVHPQQGGHWLMAESLLKAWNAPALVSSVAFDVTARTPTINTRNAEITGLHHTKTGLEWTETEEALPLPFPPPELDPVLGLTLKLSDIVTVLDQETLQVSGLPIGIYDLLIDAQTIATFSAEQLRTGVNLATLDTPMLNQARLVAADTQERNVLESARFDLIHGSLETQSSKTAATLAAAMPAAEARQRRDARPRPHRFEIRLQSAAQP